MITYPYPIHATIVIFEDEPLKVGATHLHKGYTFITNRVTPDVSDSLSNTITYVPFLSLQPNLIVSNE